MSNEKQSPSELSRRDALRLGAFTASTLLTANIISKAASQPVSAESAQINDPYVAKI